MTSTVAIAMISNLISINLFIHALEFYFLSRKRSFFEIWSYSNLKNDLERGLPLPNKLIEVLFSEQVFKFFVLSQIIFSFIGLFYFNIVLCVLLLMSHLYICIRFRGTFNGGSDMMTFVVLTGLLIFYISPTEKAQNLSLIYITIHTVFSYFKAGLIKIKQSDWRSGQALPAFLSRSLFPDIQRLAGIVEKRKDLSIFLCWSVLLFELASIAIVFSASISEVYFLGAFAFHFMIYLIFGLNRFFWAWLSAWPAVLYTATLIPTTIF